MKKIIIPFVSIFYFSIFCSAQYTVIKTPTNVSVEGIDYQEASSYWLTLWESQAASWISQNHSDAIRIGPASLTYNCHDYAWNSSDGGVLDWMNKDDQYSNANVAKYWSSPNPTYTATTLENATKVFFPDGDHSQIISTTSPGWYQSKWGQWPLYKHSLYSQPFPPYTGMLCFKLNITGDNFACIAAQKAYSTLNISNASYVWNAVNFSISGSTYNATAIANGNGQGNIQVSITSPYSNTTIHGSYPVWVGPPIITNQKVDGNNYYSQMLICPGNHVLNVTPTGGNCGTASWTVPSGVPYYVWGNELDFTFPSSMSSVAISAHSSNNCGLGSNYYFYLNKKPYGCSGYYGFTLYPNPASNDVTVTMDDNSEVNLLGDTIILKANATKTFNNNPFVYKINIYNSQSSLMYSATRSGKSFDIPLSTLNDGVYIVEINDGNNSYRQQLIVNRK